jgi:hypothetical protein
LPQAPRAKFTSEEVRYLVEGIARVFRAITQRDRTLAFFNPEPVSETAMLQGT